MLNDPATIIGLIGGIEDVVAGDVITLEEFRAERRRTSQEDDAALGWCSASLIRSASVSCVAPLIASTTGHTCR